MKLIGLMTLLWGGAYAAVGARLLLVWANLLLVENNDLSDRIILQFDNPIPILALVGVLFLVVGIMALFAALGVFWDKLWARALTLLVGLLAISLGLGFHAVVPPTSGILDGTDVWLSVAQVVYGSLAFAVLSMNPVEPVGMYILRLLNILVGLPVVVYLGFSLPEFVPGFFHQEGTSRGDLGSRFLALAVSSGFVAGLLIVATGVGLLIPRLKRFATVHSLMLAAGSAEVAMAAFALLGAFLGRSKGGLLEAYLLVFVFPFAVLLLLLTASGIWYLRRPAIRRALEAERE